jgi:uncharacterized tellurite resistance protein B-like protein
MDRNFSLSQVFRSVFRRNTPHEALNGSTINTHIPEQEADETRLSSIIQELKRVEKRLQDDQLKAQIKKLQALEKEVQSLHDFEIQNHQQIGIEHTLDLIKDLKSVDRAKIASDRAVDDYEICPIDSTVITLTSKLLWVLGYHQVKLFSVFNKYNQTGEYPLVNFGQDHDYNFATQLTENLGEKQVGAMDRGFAALEYLKQLQEQKKLFVIHVNTNYKLELSESDEWLVGTGKEQGIYRVVWFCDLETKFEYRLVTNLPNIIADPRRTRYDQSRGNAERRYTIAFLAGGPHESLFT